MIRVELGEAVHPKKDSPSTVQWRWTCAGYGVEGRSRQPLLDACREIKRMGGPTDALVGLFSRGSLEPRMICSVGWGSVHAVNEHYYTAFAKWKPHPYAVGGLVVGTSP